MSWETSTTTRGTSGTVCRKMEERGGGGHVASKDPHMHVTFSSLSLPFQAGSPAVEGRAEAGSRRTEGAPQAMERFAPAVRQGWKTWPPRALRYLRMCCGHCPEHQTCQVCAGVHVCVSMCLLWSCRGYHMVFTTCPCGLCLLLTFRYTQCDAQEQVECYLMAAALAKVQ